jgi:hypothetical protein
MSNNSTFNHCLYSFNLFKLVHQFISSTSIYYCIININIHKCIINNNKHIHTIHNTPIFTWKPNVGENHKILFLYVKNYIQGSTNFQFSSSNWKEAPTPWFLRLQNQGSSKSLILWLQPEGGYNPLGSPATTRRWI